jgi:malate dehydrogenase
MKKVTVLGAGNVGTNCALFIAEKNMADVTLIDVKPGYAAGKALDLMESGPIRDYDVVVKGSDDLYDLVYSDVVVVAAGKVREPGMSREDVLENNLNVADSFVKEIAKFAPDAVIIVVTEPVDAMTYYLLKRTGLSPNCVMGMAGVLDATRAGQIIAEKLNVAATDVEAMLIGGHHDHMIFLPQYSRVTGIPVSELLSADEIEIVEKKVKNAGHEILEKMKRATAFYAPAASVARMVETIIRQRHRILSAPVYVTGEYGLKDLCIGLPVLLDEAGIRRIIELKLTDDQKAALETSAGALRKTQEKLSSRLKEMAS